MTASLLRTDHLDRHVVRRLGRSQRNLHLPATLSTSPPNGSVYGDAVSAAAGPGEPLTIDRVEKLAQETTGIDKDNYAKMTQGGFKEHADA